MVSKYLLKSNAGKYHFLASSCGKVSLNVNNYNIENSKTENLLGVKFDITLTFDEHVSDLYKKKLVGKYMQGKNTFMSIPKQFNYCPLI